MLGEDVADPAGGVSGVTARASRPSTATDRVLDTPISEAAIVGAAIGAAARGHARRARDHDHGLHRHRHRPDREPRGQVAVHVGRSHARARSRFGRRCSAVSGPARPTHSRSRRGSCTFPGSRSSCRARPRDAKGLLTSAIFDPDPCVFMETVLTYGARGPVPDDPGFSDPARRRPT